MGEMSSLMPKLFISYNRKSAAVAESLVKDIESLGHDVWIDQELSGGQAWWDEILARIRDCDGFLLLMDAQSLNSIACKRESAYAAELCKTILPVLVADGVSLNLLPPELARLQIIDYRNQDRPAALRLARALSSLPPSRSLPDPLPSPPEVPISYLGGLGGKVDALTLSYEQQSTLLMDLTRSIRDSEAAEDARALLARLRKRRDLYATIAEEIDDVLKPMQAAIPAHEVTIEPSIPRDPRQDRLESQSPFETLVRDFNPRILGAFAGAIVGALLGVLFASIAAAPNDVPIAETAMIFAAIFASSGAITRLRLVPILWTIAGLTIATVVSWMLVTPSDRQVAPLLGCFYGSVPGSIVGAIVERMRVGRKR